METIELQHILLLLVGFYLLIKGAELLIEGAGSIAKKFGLSDIIIALTVVAFGTSAPEMGINLISAIQDNSELAVGNIIGSNITNLTLILGVAGIFGVVKVKGQTVWKEIPMLILASLLMIILASDHSLGDGWSPHFSLADSLTFLMFFAFFLGYVISSVLENKETATVKEIVKDYPLWKAILSIIGGILGLTIGGNWIVDISTYIADVYNISDGAIGMSLVAIGTSLPELATTVVAAWKKKPDIIVGNLIGSNIFNICWVLAITVLVRPISINKLMLNDMYWMISAVIIVFTFMLMSSKGHELKRWQGLLLVIFYCLFNYNIYLNL